MAFSPNSTVYLLDTPLDNTYKNQIRFTSLSAQYSYFISRLKHSFEGVTYQRKDNLIKVNKNIDELWNANYVMYNNANFGSKWFYAFITKMEYVSDHVTNIYIETDVFQTWLFECTINKSFVVREHVNDDTIGNHLVDEQLEIGEYKMYNYHQTGELGDNWNILAVSDNSPFGNNEQIGNLYGHVMTGLTYFPFPNNSTGVTWLKDTIELFTNAGKIDAIVMIFTVPWLAIRNTVDDENWQLGYPITSGESFGLHVFSESKELTNIDGYTPKNNKLFTYPYKFLYASNSDGLSATYRYEDFDDVQNMGFTVFSVVTPNPKVMLAPNGYKGGGFYEYGLLLSGYPQCSWTSDAYTAWIAQNGASSIVSLLASGGAIVGGALMGNALATTGGIVAITHQLTQIRQASIQPDQAKGQTGTGNLMFGTNAFDFYFAHMHIKAEFAKRVDDFFTQYGYKVNTLKIPELHSRLYWNYIQTIDINISGSIPDDDMRILKGIYNNGVTLWHNPTYFLNYELDNTII